MWHRTTTAANLAAGGGRNRADLLPGDLVRPLSGVALRGFDLQAHPFPHRATDEAPDAVVHPAGRLRDLAQRGSVLPAQQVQDRRLFRVRPALGSYRFGVSVWGGLGYRLLTRRLLARFGLGRGLPGAGGLGRGGLLRRNRRAG